MKKPSLPLTIIISLHLALGLLYDWATPSFEASDEGSHFAVVHWLAQGHSLPVQNPQAPSEQWAQEGSQPPLYYLLAAGLTAWIDTHDFDQVFIRNPLSRVGIPGTTHNANLYRHASRLSTPSLTGTMFAVKLARWFSLLLSCLTVLLTFKLALRLFPRNESLALLASALVAFNSMALFINASVNNDNLLMLLSTAALLATVNLMQTSPSSPDDSSTVVRRGGWGGEVILGLLLGAAALTKVSGLVLWPVAAVAVILDGGRTTEDGRQTNLLPSSFFLRLPSTVYRLLLVFSLASLLSFWWYWRNYQLYGDWLGLKTMIAIAGPRASAITLWQLIHDEWRGFLLSYWGVFGAFTILPPRWVQFFFDGLMLWALVGGGWAFLKRRLLLRAELLLLGLFCLLTLVGLVNWTMQTSASQGRLMFGAIAPLSIFMAAGILAPFEGLRTASRDRGRTTDDGGKTLVLGPWSLALGPWPFGIWSLGFGLFLLAALLPPAFIAPHYAPPPLVREFDLPQDLQPVQATFGDGIELIGYQVDDKPRTPGQTLPVTFYWRALKPMTTDYVVAMHLLGRDAAEVGKIDTWPGGGNAPTSEWSPGTILADTYQLPINTQVLTPSLLRLDLKFWESDPANTLPITALDGHPLSSVAFTVGRIIAARPMQFSPAHAEGGSTFEYGIKLLGLDTEELGAFTLYWQTEQAIPADYTVFVHLLDSQGTQVAQADAPPLDGDWPTSAWVAGQPFADPRRFDLSASLPPGVYNLRLGFYDPASGARLAAFQPNGIEWVDDAVVIEHVFEIN